MTTEIATIHTGDLVVSSFPKADEVGQALRSGARLTVEATEGEAGLGRSLSALEATSVDEVFGSELTSPKTILGTPLTLIRFDGLRNSDYDDSTLGVWAIFTATTPDGESLTIGTGATDPVVKLVKLHELGAFDGKTVVAFEESKKATANGYHPLNLIRINTVAGF